MNSGPSDLPEYDLPEYDRPEYDRPEGVVAPGSRRRRVVRASTLEEWEQDEPERYVRYRRSGGWGRRLLAAVGIIVLLAIVGAVGAIVYVNDHLNGHAGTAVPVTLPDQASHAVLAADLSKVGAVSNTWLFREYLSYRGYPPVAAGTYTVHKGEGYRAALHDIGLGPAVTQVRFTIPEGYGLAQIAAAVGKLPGLSAQKFLQLATSGAVRSQFEPAGSNNLEGLLFPDTYFINTQDDEQTILQRMVNRFDSVATAAGVATSAQSNGLTPYQTIVLASLVEREAKVDGDRAKIARVIVNRLQKGMRLQIDATVEYAEGVHKTRLLDSDLKTNSPYNTYLVTGLPPGPIASPGKASIDAALNPTPGSWLYYVLIDPSGAHGFATTPAEFNRLKAEAQAKGLL